MYSFLLMFMNNFEKYFEYLYCKEFKYLIEYSFKDFIYLEDCFLLGWYW